MNLLKKVHTAGKKAPNTNVQRSEDAFKWLQDAHVAEIKDKMRALTHEAQHVLKAKLCEVLEAVPIGEEPKQSEAALRQSIVIDAVYLGAANTADNSKSPAAPVGPPDGPYKVVMDKYYMGMSNEDVAGEGSSSICRLGTEIATGKEVAIKVYKQAMGKQEKKEIETMLFCFRRQVEVLLFLQEPFDRKKIKDKALWCDALASASPDKLFMTIVDYSQDKNGKPAPFAGDGIVYIVTELAQYSMKDLFTSQREEGKTMPKTQVQWCCYAILKVVAALHAKGLVHLDLKPENLMMFDGNLKLIDVDGCVQLGSTVHISDSSLSFSPCYCAPEWAEFLISEESETIPAAHGLDVWSIGMTVCELVNLNAILKGMYTNFLGHASEHDHAAVLFLEWLSQLKKCPLPISVKGYDPQFVDLVSNWLLVSDKKKRKTCAQSLAHPYFAGIKLEDEQKRRQTMIVNICERIDRNRPVDNSKGAPLHKGTLLKLDSNGDPQSEAAWRKRDMWLCQAGSLCYFSVKENKRLVLVDGSYLGGGSVAFFKGSCMPHAFEIKYNTEDDEEKSVFFAAESAQDCKVWIRKIKGSVRMDMPTFHMNQVTDIRKFHVEVSRASQVACLSNEEVFEPVFKEKLWKLKAEGDPMKEEHWCHRDMWICKNHSLVYYCKKSQRDLVYYTAPELMEATIKISTRDSLKPYGFQVQLPMEGEICFPPCEFAASTEQLRDLWMREFAKLHKAPVTKAKPKLAKVASTVSLASAKSNSSTKSKVAAKKAIKKKPA